MRIREHSDSTEYIYETPVATVFALWDHKYPSDQLGLTIIPNRGRPWTEEEVAALVDALMGVQP